MLLLFSPVDSRWRKCVAVAKKFGKRECGVSVRKKKRNR